MYYVNERSCYTISREDTFHSNLSLCTATQDGLNAYRGATTFDIFQ